MRSHTWLFFAASETCGEGAKLRRAGRVALGQRTDPDWNDVAGTVDQYTDPDWNDVAGTVDQYTDPDWNDVAGTGTVDQYTDPEIGMMWLGQ